jgi:hypothetical protein
VVLSLNLVGHQKVFDKYLMDLFFLMTKVRALKILAEIRRRKGDSV